MVRSTSCSPPGDSPSWQNTSEAILNFGIRLFYTFSLLISIKIKALCFHHSVSWGPEPLQFGTVGLVCMCVCDCVHTITECLMALIKQEVEIFYSQRLKNSAINTELLIVLWRILESDHFSAERNLQARPELLQGVTKIICLREIKGTPWHFKNPDCFHSTCPLTVFCVKISLQGCSQWRQLGWRVAVFDSHCAALTWLQNFTLQSCFFLLYCCLPQAERGVWSVPIYSFPVPPGTPFVVANLPHNYWTFNWKKESMNRWGYMFLAKDRVRLLIPTQSGLNQQRWVIGI